MPTRNQSVNHLMRSNPNKKERSLVKNTKTIMVSVLVSREQKKD
jgi:hypothetical protein